MYEFLWLLLPIAAASGWFAAQRSARRRRAATPASGHFRADYFKGLNYLLNEQPDKAIEVFIRMLEVDADTVETHLALGNLFRRRGEVDRAIRIHQNIIAREQLEAEERGEALLELGQDYMRAGLLDRAEGLFRELTEEGPFRERALGRLTEIYQQEKDWDKAVEAARELETATGKPRGAIISHYYCEQAEDHTRQGNVDGALRCIHRALDVSSQCVRASLVEGQLLQRNGDFRGAVRAYKRVEQQSPAYLSEVIEPLSNCYRALGRSGEMVEYLDYVMERYGGITSILARADIKGREEGEKEAIAFLTEQMRRRPSVRGLHQLIHLALAHVDGRAREYLLILRDLTEKLLEDRPVYACDHCGFSGKSLHWQCPSCKHWGTVKPIQGVEGE